MIGMKLNLRFPSLTRKNCKPSFSDCWMNTLHGYSLRNSNNKILNLSTFLRKSINFYRVSPLFSFQRNSSQSSLTLWTNNCKVISSVESEICKNNTSSMMMV